MDLQIEVWKVQIYQQDLRNWNKRFLGRASLSPSSLELLIPEIEATPREYWTELLETLRQLFKFTLEKLGYLGYLKNRDIFSAKIC